MLKNFELSARSGAALQPELLALRHHLKDAATYEACYSSQGRKALSRARGRRNRRARCGCRVVGEAFRITSPYNITTTGLQEPTENPSEIDGIRHGNEKGFLIRPSIRNTQRSTRRR